MTKEEILKTLNTKVPDGTITEILREIVTPVVIAPKVAKTIVVDAYALGQLAKILEKKDTSIFDVILDWYGDDETSMEKIVSISRKATSTYIFNINSFGGDDGSVGNTPITYTSTQYEGLAAVQEAGAKAFGEFIDRLPGLENREGFLVDDNAGILITDLDGHKISVTATDRKLTMVAISEEIDNNGIKVPFEEIQKLVGLPITV